MSEEHETVVVRYERTDAMVRITTTNLTNHELREILVGLWSRMEVEDRIDHLAELRHYAEDPGALLSPVASAIKLGSEHPHGVDLLQMIARGERIKP